MESAILSTKSQKDLNLILQLARKLGISTKKLTKEEIEDYGFSIAINDGKTLKGPQTYTGSELEITD